MAKLVRKTTINAPVDKVFHYLEDKNHFPEFWPAMMEVSDVRDLPNGGKHFHWLYKMAGMRFEGDTDEIEFEPNRKMIGKNEKGIESTISWLFDEREDLTELTFEADYRVPVPLLGKLAENIIVKLNENEAEAMLANIKTTLEV